MSRSTLFGRMGLRVSLLLLLASAAFAQSGLVKPTSLNKPIAKPPLQARPLRFVKAFIVDDRLSALRREPDMQSQVMQRLRLGRRVFILASKGGRDGQPTFYRVAVTRRTRGWIHEAAVILPMRAGEPERVLKLIDTADDSLDRIALCRLFVERFARSPLVPRVMLTMAKEADRASQSLSRRANKRLADVNEEELGVKLRDFYLNDSGLDRYSRLHVRFSFNEETSKYVYDGQAYRELINRFPSSDEANRARKQLERNEQKLGSR